MSPRHCAINQAVLLVGGLGMRLRPLTCRMPKAALPLLNRPLLSYELELLGRSGVSDVILAVAYQADRLIEALGDGSRWGVRLRFCQDPMPLDTAGAIKHVEPLLGEHFFVANGDLVLDTDLAELADAHLHAGADLTILVRRVADVSPFGLIGRDSAGLITSFQEKISRDESGGNTVSTGLYVMSRPVLDRIPAGQPYSCERALFPKLLAGGAKLLGYLPEQEGYWADVGRVESYLATSRELLDGAIDWVRPLVESGVEAGLVTLPVCIGPQCRVLGQIGPHVALGPGCTVGRGAKLQDCVALAGACVGEDAVISDAILAPGAAVPPRARITGGVYDTNG